MSLLMDPPQQAELRRVLQKAFTAKRIGAQESLIRDTARTLLDAISSEDEVDLVSTFTGPFPIIVIAELLGVDPCDRDLFKEWSNGIMATAAGDYESLVRNYDYIFDYFRWGLAARHRSPRDDLITALVQAEVDGQKLTDDDILGFC